MHSVSTSPNQKLGHFLRNTFTIILSISTAASEQDIIRGAFNEISSKTCVSFRQRTNENDYVAIRRGAVNSGCWSYVGRIGGRQELNLQPPEFPGAAHCIWVGTAAHELTHAIGFEHEQSRTDRDDYVEMNWSNIPTGIISYRVGVVGQKSHELCAHGFIRDFFLETVEYHYAFDKYGPELVSGFGAPYDYRSIMHYDAYAFAINPSIPTIIPKQAGAVLGGDQLTSYDILKINNMYKC